MSGHIAVVECVSNGVLYMDDIISKGYRPLVVRPMMVDGDSHLAEMRRESEAVIGDKADYIDDRGDFDALIRELRGYDIALCVPGSENGVALSDRICDALGLPGNPLWSVPSRTDKAEMQRAVAEAGLRSIRGTVVDSEEGIRGFWEEVRPSVAVIKPAVSAAAVGFHVCPSVEACVEALREDLRGTNYTGGSLGGIVIQEFVSGQEIVVDTVSVDGRHSVADVWMYDVEMLGSDGLAFEALRSAWEPGPEVRETIGYALAVLDAVGHRNGPCHSEFIHDGDGPVLVEINARPMGGRFSVEAFEHASGHHITDVSLDAMLDPEGFVPRGPDDVTMRPLLDKILRCHSPMRGRSAPLKAIAERMRGFNGLFLDVPEDEDVDICQTRDFVRIPGIAEFLSDDPEDLVASQRLLSRMERENGAMLYASGPYPASDHVSEPMGGLLRYTDGSEPQGNGGCEISLRDGFRLEDRYRELFGYILSVERGGTALVRPETYGNMPGGALCVGLLAEILEAGWEETPDGVRITVARDDRSTSRTPSARRSRGTPRSGPPPQMRRSDRASW